MAPVIVVGAGPVGLALTLALARNGVPVTLFDESAAVPPPRLARTAVLRPDTVQHLRRLGCGPAMDTAGTRWGAWRTMRRDKLHERVEFGDSLPSPLHVPQHTLTTALRSALERETSVRLVPGARVVALEQDDTGVTAHTRRADGTGDADDTTWHGSYLIGCDGARSTVRKLLGIRFPGRTAVERHAVAALRTTLPWPGEALLHRSPRRRDAEDRDVEVTARPLPDGVWRLDWLLPPGRELVTPEALLARIGDALADWSGEEAPGRSRHAEAAAVPYTLLDTGVHTVHHRLARSWRQGRAFLAGDAAHLLGTLGTHGLDEGFRDVENLAWKLALCWHQGQDDTLLDSYEDERRRTVATRLRHADQVLPLLREGIRGGGLRRVLPRPGARPLTLLTDGHVARGALGTSPTYTRSPLTPGAGGADAGTGTPLTLSPVDTAPGARVVDVPVATAEGQRVGLHDRLGRGLLVLLVAPGTAVWDQRHWMSAGLMPRLNHVVANLSVPAEVLVTEAYPGAAAHTVLVVRPDGHLLAALDGVRSWDLQACAALLWRGITTSGAPELPAPRSTPRGDARRPGGAVVGSGGAQTVRLALPPGPSSRRPTYQPPAGEVPPQAAYRTDRLRDSQPGHHRSAPDSEAGTWQSAHRR